MSKIVIVAKLRIKEEFRDEVYRELLSLQKNTNELDKGCIQYELHKIRKHLEKKCMFLFSLTDFFNTKVLPGKF